MLGIPAQSLRDIARLSPLAVYELTLEGEVRLWNHGAELMFGWTEGEILGRTNSTVPSENLLEYEGDLLRLLAGSTVDAKNVRRLHKHGRYLEARLWAAPTHNMHHEITGTVATLAGFSAQESNDEVQSQIYRSEDTLVESVICLRPRRREDFTRGSGAPGRLLPAEAAHKGRSGKQITRDLRGLAKNSRPRGDSRTECLGRLS